KMGDDEVKRGRYNVIRRDGHMGVSMMSGYRGQGIGSVIIETLVRESRRAGLRTLEVEFLAENDTARRAYQKGGFKQAGIILHKIFRDGKYFDGLIMAREL